MRESQTSIEEHPKFATGRAMAMQASNGMEFHMLGKTRLTTCAPAYTPADIDSPC